MNANIRKTKRERLCNIVFRVPESWRRRVKSEIAKRGELLQDAGRRALERYLGIAPKGEK